MLTRTIRDSGSEIAVEPDEHNGLSAVSAAQCQHIRSVAVQRVTARMGDVGPVVPRQFRDVGATIIDV